MSSMSDYLEVELRKHIFRTGSFTKPSTLYVGLFTVAPSDSGGGTEVTGGSYARVQRDPLDANWTAPVSTGGGAPELNGTATATASGQLDAGSTPGSAPDYGRYVYRYGKRLLRFRSRRELEQAVAQIEAAEQEIADIQARQDAPKRAAKKIRAKVLQSVPAEVIDLPAVQEWAEITNRIAEWNAAYNAQRYADIVRMFEQMRDDDERDVEALLLTVI